MARRTRRWRARNAVTQAVMVIEATNANIHAPFLKVASGPN
jgi:hypothetical protein